MKYLVAIIATLLVFGCKKTVLNGSASKQPPQQKSEPKTDEKKEDKKEDEKKEDKKEDEKKSDFKGDDDTLEDEKPLAGFKPSCYTIDFDKMPNGQALPAGAVITGQYSDWGVSFRTKNNNRKHPNKAITFSSSDPTGEDFDLMTPGNGENNDKDLGNVLVIAESDRDSDNDGLVDVPDDEGKGGYIEMSFAKPVDLVSVDVIDIDEEVGGSMKVTGTDGVPKAVVYQILGDNSVEHVKLSGMKNTMKVRVDFPGSGAFDNVKFCTTSADGKGDSKGDDVKK